MLGSFQFMEWLGRHLEDRIERAMKLCKEEMGMSDLKHLVVCGGVAANK